MRCQQQKLARIIGYTNNNFSQDTISYVREMQFIFTVQLLIKCHDIILKITIFIS